MPSRIAITAFSPTMSNRNDDLAGARSLATGMVTSLHVHAQQPIEIGAPVVAVDQAPALPQRALGLRAARAPQRVDERSKEIPRQRKRARSVRRGIGWRGLR